MRRITMGYEWRLCQPMRMDRACPLGMVSAIRRPNALVPIVSHVLPQPVPLMSASDAVQVEMDEGMGSPLHSHQDQGDEPRSAEVCIRALPPKWNEWH